jgi:hypothetical protein
LEPISWYKTGILEEDDRGVCSSTVKLREETTMSIGSFFKSALLFTGEVLVKVAEQYNEENKVLAQAEEIKRRRGLSNADASRIADSFRGQSIRSSCSELLTLARESRRRAEVEREEARYCEKFGMYTLASNARTRAHRHEQRASEYEREAYAL